jgi:TetR/AcrR family transcriptional repressor of nem operon
MKKKDTYTEIIRIGTDIIARKGFNATGIDAILKAAKVPKGSFYHYFGSKEAFGLAVLDNFAERYEQKLASFFQDETVPHLKRLRNYLEYSSTRIEANSFAKGCLAGSMGQELADHNEAFRMRVEEIFQSWKRLFGDCFRAAEQAGEITGQLDPEQLAEFLLTGLEGAVLRAKVMKSLEPIQSFINILFDNMLVK